MIYFLQERGKNDLGFHGSDQEVSKKSREARRVGSGPEVFETSRGRPDRVGSGRVGSPRPNPTRGRSDPAHEKLI